MYRPIEAILISCFRAFETFSNDCPPRCDTWASPTTRPVMPLSRSRRAKSTSSYQRKNPSSKPPTFCQQRRLIKKQAPEGCSTETVSPLDGIGMWDLPNDPKNVRIISVNKDEYPPYEVDVDDVRIIGQVIWFARQLVRDE
jgi:hypothetical protein